MSYKKNCVDPDPDPAESSKATGPDRRRLLVYAAELCCHQTQFWDYVEILEKGAPEDAVSDFEPIGEGAWTRTILEAAGCMKMWEAAYTVCNDKRRPSRDR